MVARMGPALINITIANTNLGQFRIGIRMEKHPKARGGVFEGALASTLGQETPL